MLRRANSKSSSRLSRRKSTSAIYGKQDHIDPELARQHAQAAATHAFARAYERGNPYMGSSGEVSRNYNMPDQRRVPGQDNEIDQRGRGLKRQQSVRFTGPEAVPRRRSIGTRASQGGQEERIVPASLRPRALTNDVLVPAAYRPPSRSSSIGKASIGKATAQSIVTALAAYDEYYTREDDIASTPSSYRRMRKSKSTRTLYSPTKAPSIPFTDAKDSNDYNTRIWNRVPWIPSQQNDTALRAPKSMSFLRGGRDHMTPAVRQDHDTAVQMARDKFLHQIEQQRLREQPSFLFRAKARREDKPFRQSVRSGSTSSYGIPVESANQIAQPKGASLRKKVRRASQTIRKKFNELFRRGVDQIEDAKIPDQQVEARSSGADNSYVVGKSRQHEFLDVPHPDNATISRVASRVPSLHTVPSNQQLKSRNGSVRSQRSDASMKSRVTSWTSTADDTAMSRQAQAEREAQRLSIIQENGAHVSSSSFARSGVSNQFSAYPMFHRPRSTNSRGAPSRGPVDSQKVYSALMKRLDENSSVVKLDAQPIIRGERYGAARRIPPRSTSVGSHHSIRGSETPATIRHVKEDTTQWKKDAQMNDESFTPLPQENDDVFSPKPTFDNNMPTAYVDRNGSSIQCAKTPSHATYPLSNCVEGTMLPPQLLAARNDLLLKPPKAPRETRSTFFGNSSFTTPRSTSPYRRALAEADYNPTIVTGKSSVVQSPNRVLFAPPIVHCSDPKEVVTGAANSDGAYSESVYSRTTSGRNPDAESSQPLALIEDEYHFGAVQVDRQTYQPTGLSKSRKSPSGSVDWQGWTTPEASTVEKPEEGNGLVRINYALPSMPKSFGHFREHAQITEEETEVAQRKVSMPKQPIGILQQRTPQPIKLKPILQHKSSTSLDSFPLPPLPPPPPPPLPPPAVPIRSPLRSTQSRTSLRSIDQAILQRALSAPSSANKYSPAAQHSLLRPNSSTNINRSETPAKLIKRNRRPSNNHNPSPGIVAAVERQFGSAGSRTPYLGVENYSPAEAARTELYGTKIAGQREIGDTDAQAMGSRVMVDMFLSNRRRKVAGSDESNAFL